MNMAINQERVEREYSIGLLKVFLERVFKKNNKGIFFKEVMDHFKSSEEDDKMIGKMIFEKAWIVVMYALWQSKAPIDLWEEVEEYLKEFFTDAETQKSYGDLIIAVIEADQHTLQTFRSQKWGLQMEEGSELFTLNEEQEDILNEDMLRSLIKLAFLPTRRLPMSSSLMDRQKWTFSDDLYRLINEYLPDSGIETTNQELKEIILSEIPKLNKRLSLLELVDDYDLTEELISLEVEEIKDHEDVSSLEVVVARPVEEVTVSVIMVDGKTHITGIGEQIIEFSKDGILDSIKIIPYSLETIDEFKDELVSLLFKIMEALRGPKDLKFSLALVKLGLYKDILHELKVMLQNVFTGKDFDEIKKNAKLAKFKTIVDAINAVDAEISELMPMSHSSKPIDTCKIQ